MNQHQKGTCEEDRWQWLSHCGVRYDTLKENREWRCFEFGFLFFVAAMKRNRLEKKKKKRWFIEESFFYQHLRSAGGRKRGINGIRANSERYFSGRGQLCNPRSGTNTHWEISDTLSHFPPNQFAFCQKYPPTLRCKHIYSLCAESSACSGYSFA